MRIRRIDLPGFGCLADFHAEFAPGLNVFYGRNEAGKSTLQQAICAMLYGFFDNDRARPDETARQDRFRPWNGVASPYRGSLEYELSDGRSFEVRRDFSTGDVPTQLVDLVTGADVTPQFGHGRHGNIPFARRQLGMSRSVFQSCAFIGQGEVLNVAGGASPREIGDAIAALADSSRRDVSAAGALTRLDGLVQRIGSDRARTAELPKAREHVRLAETELATLDAARRAVASRAAELQASQARLARVESEATRTRVLSLKAKVAALQRRLLDLGEADEELARAETAMRELAPFAAFPAAFRDQVLTLRDRRARAFTDVERTSGDLGRRRSTVTGAERMEFEALRLSVGALSPESVASLQAAAYVREDEEAPAPGNRLARFLRSIARIVAALLRAVLRRRHDESPATAGETKAQPISPEEAIALLEKHTRYIMLRPEVEALQQLESQLAREEVDLRATDDELTALLTRAAILVDNGLDQAVEAFLAGCDSFRRYEVAQTQSADASRRRTLLLAGRSPEEYRAQLADCEQRLEALLAAHPELAGLEPDASALDIAGRLARVQEEAQELAVSVARLDEEVRSSLKDHRPRAEIEEEVASWQRQVTRLEGARAAAEMAREVISEAMVAVYRDFAPAVNSFLSDGFEYITEGRYRRASVDPASLQVSLLVPETDQVIADPPVSRGTLTVAYVLMRMGLAQHMSNIAEPVPLVLDDPFVDLDDQRLARMLEFLFRLTERTQLFLFTKDTQVLRWFETGAAGRQHRLHRLSSLELSAAVV